MYVCKSTFIFIRKRPGKFNINTNPNDLHPEIKGVLSMSAGGKSGHFEISQQNESSNPESNRKETRKKEFHVLVIPLFSLVKLM